jgi:hypothetical protein
MIPTNGTFLDFDGFFEEIRRALDVREPYMFTRYGDGEGLILGYPEDTTQDNFEKRINKWFSIGAMGRHEQIAFGQMMRDSVVVADMIGIPGLRHADVNFNWRSVHIYLNKYKLVRDDHLVCSMDNVLELQKRKLYPILFKGIDSVAAITCRDIEGLCRDKLGFKQVDILHTPPQLRPHVGPRMTETRHYPEIYEQVPEWIESVSPSGKLFLVGAGGLGKVYCTWIKQAGGIAFDIGSVLDGWVGAVTRSHISYDPAMWRL